MPESFYKNSPALNASHPGKAPGKSRWQSFTAGLKTAAIAGAALPALAVAFSLPAGANLVTNGGFVPNASIMGSAQSGFLGNTNNTTLPGWSTTRTASTTTLPFWGAVVGDGLAISTNMDQAGLGASQGWPQGNNTGLNVASVTSVNSADGSGWFLSVDADPIFGNVVAQTITGLTPGDSYILSFSQAAAQYAGYPDQAITAWWDVTFGTSTFQSTIMAVASGDPVSAWQSQSTTFTASSSSQVLNFLAQGTPGGGPPFALLSGVSVTPDPVPGPLPVAGVAAVLGFSRKLRRRIKHA
jgi:hypothetical protein